MPIYINHWEHYSSLFSSSCDSFCKFNDANENCLSDNLYSLNLPQDLYEYVEVRGSKLKDNYTKVATYVSKKLCKGNILQNNIKSERLGVIFASEFANINNMFELSNLGIKSAEPISAQLFPNATISSGTVTVSISLKAQGLNLTINGGIVGFYKAMMIACNYISDGKIDSCIVLTGDDYNKFAMEDVLLSDIHVERFLSTLNGVLISNSGIDGEENFIIEEVEINGELSEAEELIYLAGYRCDPKDSYSKISNPDVYIGPSIGFMGLLKCFSYLETNSGIDKCSAAIVDKNSHAAITISRKKL